eukprot:Skav219563  [mRNA]  locus=scaffold886:65121:65414:- [translate_table: standard]
MDSFRSHRTLVFTREATAGTVWVFLNNGKNSSAETPAVYCPGPHKEDRQHPSALRGQGAWFDALSNRPMNQYLRSDGCFAAPDLEPKVLYRRQAMPP